MKEHHSFRVFVINEATKKEQSINIECSLDTIKHALKVGTIKIGGIQEVRISRVEILELDI